MKVDRKSLERQLADHEEQSKDRHSYVAELKGMTTKLGTNKEVFDIDLMEAENDVKYHDAEVARIKKELAQLDQPLGGTVGSILPQTSRQGFGSLIFSSIGFVFGALLGSRLKSRKDKP